MLVELPASALTLIDSGTSGRCAANLSSGDFDGNGITDIAVYEFESPETLQRFLASDHFAFLRAEYDRHFGGVSERQRATYVQVWP